MIRTLSLQNWKSHAEETISFTNGTNILVGQMGAGKSSILQAISFGLFGTFSELKSRDLKIAELVSRNSNSHIAEITLKINSAQGPFTIHRRVDSKKNSHEATVRDENEKLIAGPNPTAANEYIQRLLKVDEAVFLRAVYAMQNEIDGMLRLSPTERKRRIDELMGLDKFEVARKTAQSLKTRIKTELTTIQEIVSNLASENISETEANLRTELSKIKKTQIELEEELVRKEKQEESNRKELESMRQDSRKLGAIAEQIKSTESQINDIAIRLMGIDLTQSFGEVEKLEKQIAVEISNLTQKRNRYSKSVSEKNLLLVEVEKTCAVAESKVRTFFEKLNSFQKIELEIESLKSKHGVVDFDLELRSLKAGINQKDDQVKMNLAHMESLRRHLGELISMEGLCPLCKTKLNEQDRTQILSTTKKELAELLYTNNNLNKELDKLKSKQKSLESLSEKYSRNIEELASKESIRSEKNTEDSKLAKFRARREELKSDLFRIENLLKDVEAKISNLSERRSRLIESKHLYELKQRKYILEKDLSKLKNERQNYDIDPEKLRQTEDAFQSILRRVQELRTKKEGLESLIKEKLLRLNDIEDKKNRILKLQENLKRLQSKFEFLEKFKNALQATQLELRDELILTVNEVMSSVWLEIYPYSTWSGVRLAVDENDYILQIKDIEGNWVNVSGFASGGERMLAALAMRISFARVMVPSLSLLILDEPTHNLDEKAVQTLIEVLQERVSEFIDQILIVTHEEKLAESADNKIQLSIN